MATPKPIEPIAPITLVGHVLAALLGLQSMASAVLALRAGLPPVLSASVLIIGVLLPLLGWFAWQHRLRAAWAFETSICGVFSVITIFGAPKMVHLGMPMVVVGLVAISYICATVFLALGSASYDAGASSK
jgi:hypothetical protein